MVTVAAFGPIIEVTISSLPDGGYGLSVGSIDPGLKMDDPRVNEAIRNALIEAWGQLEEQRASGEEVDPRYEDFLRGALERTGLEFRYELAPGVTLLMDDAGMRVLSELAPLVVAQALPAVVPAIKARESRWAQYVAPFIGGVLGFLTVFSLGSALLPGILSVLLLSAYFPLAWQTGKAREIEIAEGVDRAAKPSDSLMDIMLKFGPIIGPLVFIHELVHRLTGVLGIRKLGIVGRAIDEVLAYTIESVIATLVVLISSIVYGLGRIVSAVRGIGGARAPPVAKPVAREVEPGAEEDARSIEERQYMEIAFRESRIVDLVERFGKSRKRDF